MYKKNIQGTISLQRFYQEKKYTQSDSFRSLKNTSCHIQDCLNKSKVLQSTEFVHTNENFISNCGLQSVSTRLISVQKTWSWFQIFFSMIQRYPKLFLLQENVNKTISFFFFQFFCTSNPKTKLRKIVKGKNCFLWMTVAVIKVTVLSLQKMNIKEGSSCAYRVRKKQTNSVWVL